MEKICQNNTCKIIFRPKPGTVGKYCSPLCFKMNASLLKQDKNIRGLNEQKYLLNPNICIGCAITLPYNKRKNSYCSHSCRASVCNVGRKDSNETTQKRSLNAKNNLKGFCAKGYIPKPRILKRVELICLECKEYFKVRKSETNRKYCSRFCANKNNYHPNSTRCVRSVYRGFKMDSNAELKFAKLLDKHNILWIKNENKFFTFIDSEGKERRYYPDFYLPKYNHWVEIKGRYYQRKDDNLRLQAVGDNIELMMSTNITLPKCIIYVSS